MRADRSSRLLVWACAAAAGFSTRSLAQSVLSAQSTWMPSAPPPAVPDGTFASGNATGLMNAAPAFDGFGVVDVSAKGTATSTAIAPPDSFSIQISREQTFTLSEPAQVAIPT